MEAEKRAFRSNVVRVGSILVGVLLLVWSGCSSAPKKNAPQGFVVAGGSPSAQNPNATVGSSDTYGPRASEMNSPNYGPVPANVRPVVLVLGPGVARGYAFAGVLRALSEAKIPIGAILGSEMGSLIGALYAMRGTINHFEWGLMRLKDDMFVESGGLLSRIGDSTKDGEKLQAALRAIFDHRDLADAKIPLRVTLQSQDGARPLVLDRGNAVEALRAAVAIPGLFEPAKWGGVPTVSANQARPFPIREARELGIGPVIVVNVLNDAEVGGAADELKGADLVIRPDMSGIDYLEFSKKTDAAFRGKSATVKAIPEIKRLVGLPEDPT